MHAGYRCRHSGACCSGVFAIPAEPHVVEIVRSLDIGPRPEAASLFVRRAGAPGTEFIGARRDGSCVFVEMDNGHLCAIHRRTGGDALPSSCRHFPRVFLHDARGIFVSLSHFCPTAAAMLLEDIPLAIVEAESPLVLDGTIETFDAVDALPPLLQPILLMDLEAYDAWERAAVATLAREDLTVDEAVALSGSATEALRKWKVGGRPLASSVTECFRDAGAHPLAIDDHRRDPLRWRSWAHPSP
jgi:Fe-S-cluster containining protein